MATYIDQIVSYIKSMQDNEHTYYTEHKDAGGNYSHMPREGSWCYNNNDAHLLNFIEANDINVKGLDIDTLSDIVLDNFKMVNGHIFSTNKAEVFRVDSYPVSEIESHYHWGDLAASVSAHTRLNVTVKRLKTIVTSEIRESVSVDSETFELYQCTDCVWIAQISASDLQELINDY